jgi:alpha-tubulin suppressor-like RCC1 family protein
MPVFGGGFTPSMVLFREIRRMKMNSFGSQVLVLGIFLLLVALTVGAQVLAQPDQASEPSDLEVLLRAIIESTSPVPASSVPEPAKLRGFYSVQHAADWPPLPGNIYGLDVWVLGEGFYVFDDRNVNYVELQSAVEKLQSRTTDSPQIQSRNSSMNMAVAYDSSLEARPYLTNLVAMLADDQTMTGSFDIAGGTNFVPYDILTTTNLADAIPTWTWLGIGYSSNSYTFTNQPYDIVFFALAKPEKTMTVGWGNDFIGESDVPLGLTNAVAVSGGLAHSLALSSDGEVTAWGWNGYGQTNVPTNLVGVAMVAAGWYHSVALLTNGTVTAWGYDGLGWNLTNVPPSLTNATVISAQALHSLALRGDGTVVGWGYGSFGETNSPAGLTNAIAIAAGYQHNLAVKADGTVVAWGNNSSGQCNVPAGLSNVWDVAAGVAHSVALRNDSTVIAWGGNAYGEAAVPAGLSNVVAIAAGGDPGNSSRYSLALKSDGTVVPWGSGEVLYPVIGMSNVIAIGGGGTHHALAVRTGPKTPVIVYQPSDQFQVAGGSATFTSRGAGIYGVSYQWQYGAVDMIAETNSSLTVTNVQSTNTGVYRVWVSNEMGSLVSSGANLNLVTPPVILSQSQPTNPVLIYQTNVTLSVSASAPWQSDGFPISYKWQFNGTNIAGATASNYTFRVEQAGNYSVLVSNIAGGTSAVWQVGVTYDGTYMASNTLAYHLSTNAVGYAASYAGSGSDQSLLSGWVQVYNHPTNLHAWTNAVWSTNCWLKGVRGLSATGVGVLYHSGGQSLPTMISPRHCVFAEHTHLGQDHFVAAFLGTNNVLYWRTNMETVHLGNDASVGILDSDLPPEVGYLPVLLANFTNYLPTTTFSYVQGIGMNQFMRAFSQPMRFGDPVFIFWNSTNTPPLGLGTNWNTALEGGDSSAPERLLISSEMVLATHNYFDKSGPNYAYQLNLINQAMHYLSTNKGANSDYQLTTFSLTNWPAIR